MISRTSAFLDKLGFLGPLLLRVTIGVMFAQAGWGKLEHLERTAGFFEGLGIPAPAFHAQLVGVTELLGGILLVVGLATRFAAFPLVITMCVALLTSGLPDAEGLLDALSLDEAIYGAALVWLLLAGAGKASLDALIVKYYPNLNFIST